MNTIAEIAKERMRRAIKHMQEQQKSKDGQLALELGTEEDLGFKVFKLGPSTFRQWEPPQGEDAAALEAQLSMFDQGLAEEADPQHVIYEVLLKEGYSLNAAIEPVEVETNEVYRITDEDGTQSFYICLDEAIAPGTPQALGLDRETTFVCLDTALDDSQKVNLAMQCQLKAI
jgi:adenine-specific DNA-methyltransferase